MGCSFVVTLLYLLSPAWLLLANCDGTQLVV